MRNWAAIVFLATNALVFNGNPDCVYGQLDRLKPKPNVVDQRTRTLPLLNVNPGVTVPDDASNLLIPGKTSLTSMEIYASGATNVKNTVCSKHIRDGVAVYGIFANGRPHKFDIYPNGEVNVKVLKTYRHPNLGELKADHPAIWATVHDQMAEKQSMEESAIVSIDATMTISVMTIDGLKEKHPDLFILFAKYCR